MVIVKNLYFNVFYDTAECHQVTPAQNSNNIYTPDTGFAVSCRFMIVYSLQLRSEEPVTLDMKML